MLESIDQETLYICSNNKKELLLKQLSKVNKLYNIKFMTIDEFKKEYFYTYNSNIYPYVMENYNVSYSVSKEYLNNLYYIDIDKNYENKRIEDLKKIKKDLIDNKLLIFNSTFKQYLKRKKIIIDYSFIDPYMKSIFDKYNSFYVEQEVNNKSLIVEKYSSIFDEVEGIVLKIIDLINKGISLNNIYIANVDNEYFYALKKIFKLYNIPLELDENISLNTVLFVNEYFITNKIPDIDEENKNIVKKFINLLNSFVDIKDSKYYKQIIKEELKNTNISPIKYNQSVKVVDFIDLENSDDDYVFPLNFNEGVFPSLKKDEDYLSDKEKNILGVLDSVNYNSIMRQFVYNKMTSIKNLNISYKLHGFSEEFYPSSMVEDYNMQVIENNRELYNYSDKYNKRKLSIMLDDYYKYKTVHKDLNLLLNTYKNVDYNTYNHKFKGIKKMSYLEYIDKPLKLSYTSLNAYNLCPFSYYVKYVLKVDPYEDTFQAFIGSLYHQLFSLCFYEDFDFEKSFNSYLEKRVLNAKEEFLLKRLKKELLMIIDVLKIQKKYTDFKEAFFEKELEIPLNNFEVDAIFKGIIDKIMYYKNMNDTYYAVIDYKTGSFPTSLNNMKYGLDMQLATYIYLIEKSNLFTNPIFVGCYFQKTLLGNITKNNMKSIQDEINNKLKLRGYSTIDEIILGHFDHTYTKSNIISGMSVNDKGFNRFARVLNSNQVLGLVNYTDKIIKESADNIINAKFDISPKVIDKKMKSCLHCKYRDLCYRDIGDNVELEKVEDLDFLGGD